MTILGHHTVAELRDWIEHIDEEMGRIDAVAKATLPAWKAQDPPSAAAWADEWKALSSRYQAARVLAEIAFAKSKIAIGVSDSVIPVEDEWQAVLHALSKTPGVVAPGDYQDLFNRLNPIAVAQAKPIDLSNLPQPKATDADLGVFQAANATIRAGEKAADAVLRAGKDLAPSKGTATVVVVGLGLVLGILLATKSVLR
jgi:hypothetical protein